MNLLKTVEEGRLRCARMPLTGFLTGDFCCWDGYAKQEVEFRALAGKSGDVRRCTPPAFKAIKLHSTVLA